jgi:hypothetical protein
MSGAPSPELIPFGPDANCSLDSCPLEWSVYQYRPNLGANISFAALFAVVGAAHVLLGCRWRSWGFMAGMILGSLSELAGYTGRIMLYYDPFSFRAFMMQIGETFPVYRLIVSKLAHAQTASVVCLTIAPVFYTASIYVTLSQTTVYLAPDLSRFPPALLYWIFIPADIVCLVLQAAGGALSTKSDGEDQTGVGVSLAGLTLQVIVLVVFVAIFSDYLLRYCRSRGLGTLGWELKAFLSGLLLSILLILARCAYRVAELKDGYDGETITHEVSFITCEGVLIVLAASALCVGHPGLLFGRRDRIAQ